jgi:hypothetical protein
VTEELLKDPLCMNLAIGGEGGWEYINDSKVLKFNGKRHTIETKQKIGAYHIGNKYNIGKVTSDKTKKLLSLANSVSLKGKVKTEEHKAKLAEAARAKWKIRKNAG